MDKQQLSIGTTTKGSRIWLQGLDRWEWAEGAHYTMVATEDAITLTLDAEGKKKVSKHKGGIIDLCGQWVTKWSNGHNQVSVQYTSTTITITHA